ncbi:uncharacterized protein LOC106464078 isoform X1 [Limulus polyphemus]|uniref:Uncharacterized protein LOC106464078 isoform X1 n=1 Tax=Limulus polyphemus TaxID=6850 RepID=A0ABM1SUZ1_LIMPO|nr:uncharacterized protein LOC106464078 isoform X1 [Limulus polyphemus]
MLAKGKYRWQLRKFAKFVPVLDNTNENNVKKVNTIDGGRDAPIKLKVQEDTYGGSWKYVGGDEGDLYLSYLDADYLVISKGSTLHVVNFHGRILVTRQLTLYLRENCFICCSLETVSLFNGKYWLRGVVKGDSMLIVNKLKIESRRFRVQFYSDIGRSAIEQCEDCVKILSNHIPFKYNLLSPFSQPPSIKPQVHAKKILGEVTASLMIQAVTKETELPRAYQHTNIPVNQIKSLLFLCLCDPNFPAFVRQVQKALHEIKEME